MSWAAAKARIVEVLEGLSIVSPFDENLTIEPSAVFANPPESINDNEGIVFVIYPPSLVISRANSLRLKMYGCRIRLLVKDESLETASAIFDAFREAIADVFDINVTLAFAAGVTQITGPSIEEPAEFTYGGTEFVGFDSLLGIQMREAVTFQPGS